MTKKKKKTIEAQPQPQLYKVLVDGKSCHNGSLLWSLPVDGKPGEWHEVTGTLVLCSHGLHLTDDPARWWKTGCRVYLVEAEGVEGTCADREDRKVVARRVRLMRETSAAELEDLRIYLTGKHTAQAGAVIASGSASVRASGSASVEAWGSASVRASGSASVEASGSASVEASGSASVRAWDSASVRAWDSASVEASDSASVEASDSASVRAWGSASVEASGSASVRASGSASVRAWGSASVEAKDTVTVVHIERGDNSKAPQVHVAEDAP